jgi:hypothetical protein
VDASGEKNLKFVPKPRGGGLFGVDDKENSGNAGEKQLKEGNKPNSIGLLRGARSFASSARTGERGEKSKAPAGETAKQTENGSLPEKSANASKLRWS